MTGPDALMVWIAIGCTVVVVVLALLWRAALIAIAEADAYAETLNETHGDVPNLDESLIQHGGGK